jgi:exodeoxyribonuclease VII large subunit
VSTIYQVSEIKQLLARSLKPLFYQIEELFGMITLEGVVERVNNYPSGTYVSLKDPNHTDVTITCLVAPDIKIDFEIKAGLKIQAVGTVDLKTRKNSVDQETIVLVNQLYDVSEGQMTEVEKLREKLQKAGYFGDKKPLPSIAEHDSLKICIISSVDGVAYRDIENTIKDIPYYSLSLYPTNLYSPDDVARSIEEADSRGDYDILLISRGGGNRLDVFDNMVVLKAIKHCRTPTFVAVGHTQDRTLADEAADHYAATPTAAGEYLAQIYRMHELQKKDTELAEREKKLEKLAKQEKEQLEKQIKEQQAFIKALKKNIASSEKYEKEIKILKNRLRNAENQRTTIRLTPGFVVFCFAVLGLAYLILK